MSSRNLPERPGQPIADAYGVTGAEALAGAERVGAHIRHAMSLPPSVKDIRRHLDDLDRTLRTWRP